MSSLVDSFTEPPTVVVVPPHNIDGATKHGSQHQPQPSFVASTSTEDDLLMQQSIAVYCTNDGWCETMAADQQQQRGGEGGGHHPSSTLAGGASTSQNGSINKRKMPCVKTPPSPKPLNQPRSVLPLTPINSSSGFASGSGIFVQNSSESLQRDLLVRKFANPGETESCWRSLALRRWVVLSRSTALAADKMYQAELEEDEEEDIHAPTFSSVASGASLNKTCTFLAARYNILPMVRAIAHSSFASSSFDASTQGGGAGDEHGSWTTCGPPRSLFYGTLRNAMSTNQFGGGGGVFNSISSSELVVKTAKRLLTDILWALHFCHQTRVIHGRVSLDTVYLYGSQYRSPAEIANERQTKRDLLLETASSLQSVMQLVASAPHEYLEAFLGGFDVAFLADANIDGTTSDLEDRSSSSPTPWQKHFCLPCGELELHRMRQIPPSSVLQTVLCPSSSSSRSAQQLDYTRFLKRFIPQTTAPSTSGDSSVSVSGGTTPNNRSFSHLNLSRGSQAATPLTADQLFRQAVELDMYSFGKMLKEVLELSPPTKACFHSVLRTNSSNVYQSHCGDLVQQLLTGLDTGRRPTALQVLGHPWFGLRERQVLLEHTLRCLKIKGTHPTVTAATNSASTEESVYLPWDVCFLVGEFVVGVLQPGSYRKLLWEEHLVR